MECSQIDLYEFLTDSELQQYYNVIKNELKITNAAQFKYATDEDLKHIGLSRPEIRRLRKYYEKHFPHGYLSKIKRLLQAPATMVKRDDGNSILSSHSSLNTAAANETTNAANGNTGGAASPNKVPINKHIIPADAISVNKQLGTGEFGIVQQGVWSNGTERIQVAIKCLCRERMQSNPMEFLKEAAIMHSIEHENIVRLYGVVLATDSLMLVTELAHLRSLLECLKDSGLRVSFLTVPTLCEFAMQICNGMSYLENKRLIHRDLAARNILVFSKNKVKISDFGLSRALGVGKDYYKTNFNVNLKLPIAWCAPECINYLRFTNASDVWAYGVCLWEMFSYGFQPWAALTGLQILEAIDAPNYQRLEQPDCCPQEYYTLMMKCWQDDSLKRPKFSEIYEMLPDMKPEQLKAVVNCLETKSDHLSYRQGDIITVLDRNTGTPFWKGVLNTGKTGFFNPSNTVAHLEGLPSSNRDSFCRSNERSSKRKLRTEMISKPQNDFKHTGHVGIDGASFGDIAFLGNSQSYNHVPRQIVTPYKPSEDIEQTPLLLPPTPTSPDSLQSGYFADGHHPSTSVNPSFVSSTENTPKQQSSFQFPHYNTSSSNNPFSEQSSEELHGMFALHNKNYGLERKCFTNTSASLLGEGEGVDELNWRTVSRQQSSGDDPHEYHEISDDEMTADKLDLGPSLLDEINSMFGSMNAGNGVNAASSIYQPKTPDFDQINIQNEFAEISSKMANNKNNVHLSKKKSGTGTVKPISVKDEKILNHAIEIANEISARSMNDLVSDPAPATQSPKRKFSFRFPHLSKDGKTDNTHNHGPTSHSAENDVQAAASSPYSKKKNFSEELKSIPDLQASFGDGAKEAYNSLIERKSSLNVPMSMSPAANLLRNLDTNEFDLSSSKTLPRRSIQLRNDSEFSSLADEAQSEPLNMPVQQAPRPMTLPTRGAASRIRQQFFLGNNINNIYNNRCNGENGVHTADVDGACESPTYLINTGYRYSDERRQDESDANPIPLPSREGKKHIKTNPKRHVRKYPLIIPANGVQRTLNKVTENSGSPDEEFSQCIAVRGLNLNQNQINPINFNNNNNTTNNHSNNKDILKRHSDLLPKLQIPVKYRNSVTYENTDSLESKINGNEQNREIEHTYQNMSGHNDDSCTNTPDTASLQFESILEADFNKGNVLSSPDVTDGFYNFSIQKEHYNKSKVADYDGKQMSGLYVNEDELRNLDTEKSTKLTTTASSAVVQKPKINSVVAVVPQQNNQLRVEEEEDIVTSPTNNNAIQISEESNETKSVTLPIIETMQNSSESSAEAVNAKETIVANNSNAIKIKKRVEGELADNALFKKVRESCDLSMTKSEPPPAPIIVESPSSVSTTSPKKSFENDNSSNSVSSRKKRNNLPSEMECFAASVARLTDSNSVSCEDLLEFSDKKPKGCERGVDSDEVRIMVKVLGKDSVPERCLSVLEFINWDVHKAIKVIKLQNILSTAELSLIQSVDALKKYDWDLHTTALQLRNLRN